MPKRRMPLSPEAVARNEFNDELQQAITEIAAELGPADGAAPASDKEKVRLWGIRDQKVDYDAMVQRIMTQGYPPEMLDPDGDNSLMVVRENPELAPYYGQPTEDQEMAGVLTTLAEFPFRLGILRDLEEDPEAQAKESDRINALWQKTLPPESPLMQEQPVPTMPPTAPALPEMQPASPEQPPAMPQMDMQQPAPQMPADMAQMMGG